MTEITPLDENTMWQRIWLYLNEMYPPVPSFLIAVVSFYNLFFILEILHGQTSLEISWASIGGALTLFCFLLFLRISDELKDLETDRQVFPERLVPSGRVQLKDLKVLMGLSILTMLFLNLFVTGAPLAFAVLFGFGLLMFHYFFLRALISRSLLLALITHNPSVLLMNFYVMAIYARAAKIPLFQSQHIFLAILFWLPGLAWELARKIRAPEDENEYETYSRIFGYKLATLLPMLALSAHYFMLLSLSYVLHLSWIFLSLLSLALLFVLGWFARFIQQPKAQTARLKPVTEAYMLISALGLLLDLSLSRELLWNLF